MIISILVIIIEFLLIRFFIFAWHHWDDHCDTIDTTTIYQTYTYKKNGEDNIVVKKESNS